MILYRLLLVWLLKSYFHPYLRMGPLAVVVMAYMVAGGFLCDEHTAAGIANYIVETSKSPHDLAYYVQGVRLIFGQRLAEEHIVNIMHEIAFELADSDFSYLHKLSENIQNVYKDLYEYNFQTQTFERIMNLERYMASLNTPQVPVTDAIVNAPQVPTQPIISTPVIDAIVNNVGGAATAAVVTAVAATAIDAATVVAPVNAAVIDATAATFVARAIDAAVIDATAAAAIDAQVIQPPDLHRAFIQSLREAVNIHMVQHNIEPAHIEHLEPYDLDPDDMQPHHMIPDDILEQGSSAGSPTNSEPDFPQGSLGTPTASEIGSSEGSRAPSVASQLPEDEYPPHVSSDSGSDSGSDSVADNKLLRYVIIGLCIGIVSYNILTYFYA